jgi:phosphoribosyl-AMP cyclohydrolase
VDPLTPKYNESGLVPAIVQDAASGQVLMLAWMNADAFAHTLASREAYFWSRSRQELWHKGATSGNYLHVQEVWLDCDQDAVLLCVHADGPACHTGAVSCFFNEISE